MKKTINKIIITVLSLSILFGSISVYAYNTTSTKKAEEKSVKTEEKSEKQSQKSSDEKNSKEETVYVMTKSSGEIDKIYVTNWLKNSEKKKTIKDFTNLKNIENVGGDEKYTIDKENATVWNADGKDIYYKGETEKQIPVDVSISYALDGNEISAEELAGKSGKVKIRFDYENRQFEEKVINGQKTKIYVPYIMLTGTILNNDNFSNVEVSNGKIINDGDKTYVIGFSLPGMNENLDLENTNIDLPNYFEITADVTDFELSTTLTVATNEVFNDIDLDKTDDKINEIDDKLNQLTDGMNKIIDGSSSLYKGISTLLDKSDDLIKGVKKLTSGAKVLKEKSNDIVSGTKTIKDATGLLNDKSGDLYNGVYQLYSGLGTLSSNNDELKSGAKQVFNTLLSAANTQIKANGLTVEKLKISNYSSVLEKTINSLSESNVRAMATQTAKEKITAAVEEQRAYIKTQVEVAVRQTVLEKVLATMSMTYEQYKQAVEAGLISQEQQTQIDNAVEAQMNSSDIKATINSKTQETIDETISQKLKSEEVQQQISKAIEDAKKGVESLKELKNQLDSYNKFYQGIKDYTNGVSKAYSGATQLKNGTYKLKNGTAELNDGAEQLANGSKQFANGIVKLYNGIATLDSSTPKLKSGINQLKDGSMKLSNGLKEFNNQGIKKITDVYNKDVKELYNRFKATVEVSQNYKSFSGIADNMPGSVKFIYKSAEISK